MFTGIIQQQALIKKIEQQTAGIKLTISCQYDDLELGESIAINGICLTVTNIATQAFSCQVSPETLSVTTANNLKQGDTVNLERALQAKERLGGHFVLGHVDAVGTVLKKYHQGDYVVFEIATKNNSDRMYLLPKGSIAINGVSLTINSVNKHIVTLMLIPHTLDMTNLSKLQANDPVNIEYDYLAKIVAVQSKQLCEEL